jgi:hypothetical protein
LSLFAGFSRRLSQPTSERTMTQPNDIPTPSAANFVSVTLDIPIVRGSQTITSVDLRRPKSGELRGVNLSDLAQLDVAALIKVLPRVSMPTLTSADVEGLDPSDLMKLGGEVVGFLLPSQKRDYLNA